MGLKRTENTRIEIAQFERNRVTSFGIYNAICMLIMHIYRHTDGACCVTPQNGASCQKTNKTAKTGYCCETHH